jgi:hypothetical protein
MPPWTALLSRSIARIISSCLYRRPQKRLEMCLWLAEKETGSTSKQKEKTENALLTLRQKKMMASFHLL